MAQTFNKDQAKPSQKKQLVILAVLGVVMAGLWTHYAMNHVPAAANAQGGDMPTDNGMTAVPERAPAEVLKELANDPTRDLLRGHGQTDDGFGELPNNPFAMDSKWRTVLTRPEPVAAAATQPAPGPQPFVVRQVVPQNVPPINVDTIKVQAIVRDARNKYAIINGSIVNVGAVVQGARIVEILDDHLLVVPAAAPDATPVEIFVKKRFK